MDAITIAPFAPSPWQGAKAESNQIDQVLNDTNKLATQGVKDNCTDWCEFG